MTILDSPRATGTEPEPGDVPVRLLGRLPTRSAVIIGFLAAAQAALTGLLVVLALVAAVWGSADRVGAGWPDMVRVATDVWLAGHGTTIALPTGEFALLPMGLALLLLWWSRYCADRVLDLCDDGRGTARGFFLRCLAVYVLSYALLTGAAAALVGTEDARPLLGSAVLGGGVMAGAGMAVSGYPLWRGEGPRWLRVEAIGGAVRSAMRWWLGAAAVLLLVSVVLNWGRILEVQRALQPDGVGQVGLILMQLLLAPTAVVWSGSWLAGPGFTVGEGTAISPFGTELAPVPALPLLGALPQAGPGSVWLWWAPMLVVLAGFVAGITLSRLPVDRVDQRWWWAGGQVAVGAALVTAPLLWLAAGPVGPERLDQVGPRLVLGTLWVALEVGVGAMLGMGLAPVVVDGRLSEAVRGALGGAASSRNQVVSRAGALGTRAWEGLGGFAGRGRRTVASAAGTLRGRLPLRDGPGRDEPSSRAQQDDPPHRDESRRDVDDSGSSSV